MSTRWGWPTSQAGRHFLANSEFTSAHSTEAERPFHGKLSSHSGDHERAFDAIVSGRDVADVDIDSGLGRVVKEALFG